MTSIARALTYVEIDVDFCANTYGVPPCMAALEAVSVVESDALRFDFSDSAVHGFTAQNATLTATASGALLTPTGADPIIRSGALSFSGSVERYVQIDVERVTLHSSDATWQGVIFYTTAGHPESSSFRKSFSETGLENAGDRTVITLDMSVLTVGGNDWITNTITGIRFDFDDALGGGTAGEFKIHSISIGHLATSVEATGSAKCFNTLKTCQDRANFVNAPVTLRFAIDAAYLPKDIDCIPSITDVSFSPATISLGKDLGIRATLNVNFRDHRHSDTGPGYDPYYTERDYDPFKQGSYWGKFRARQPYLKGRPIRLIRGFLGQTLAEMDTRHYILESFNGPTPQGEFTLVAKDVLKLADGDRAQAPAVSNGFLVSGISAAAVTMTLTPNGIGSEEYPESGYVAIGGSEIVAYTHPPENDAYIKILLHCDGADASTTFTDSSASARTMTANGNAQLDTAQFKFGTASGLFDGTGDFVSTPDSADFVLGSGDWTADCWFNCVGLTGTSGNICGQGDAAAAAATTSFFIGRNASNTIDLRVSDGLTLGTLSSTTAFTNLINPGWHHVAAVRTGNVLKLFIDGVQEGGDQAFTGTVPNSAELFTIGARSAAGGTMWNGWIDEFRLSVGIARWTENFTPPVAATGDGDVFTITRGQFGTEAVEHEAQDRVQLCLQYIGETPAYIIEDLLVNYAAIPSSYIPTVDWDNEVTSFLQRLYSALIAEPTDVNKLVSELVEQAALALWWDDRNQHIALKVLRAISVDADIYNEDNTLEGTLQISEQPDTRASQIWTYYGQRNPLRPIDEPDNFRSTLATVNLQAETDEGQAAIMKIFSRWIPAFGRDTADRLNTIQLGRFQVPPRKFQLEVFRGSVDEPVLGGGYRVEGWSIQDEFGAPSNAPIQITRLNANADRFTIEAEEMLFETLDTADLLDRTIIIDSNINNVNLRTIHDGIYPEPVAFESPSITVTCIIESGVIVGSDSQAAYAFDMGTWPLGVTLNLIVNGRIQGYGGQGGDSPGQDLDFTVYNGEAGGNAFYTRASVNVTDEDGQIWGGGGGGGALFTTAGSGGSTVGAGGGQGQNVGGNGEGEYAPTSAPSSEAPGPARSINISGSTYRAGAGGAAGTAGDNAAGATAYKGVGGAAGGAIDGLSFITQVGPSGDRRGVQVN